jgi:hypothetical protein
MNGKGKRLLVGWGFRGRKYGVSATEFFEDIHTHNTSEQAREDIWINWFFGAFVDQEKTSYTVSAQSANLLRGYVMPVDVESLTAAAQDITYLRSRVLPVSNATATVTINPVTFVAAGNKQLAITTASYTASAQSIGLGLTRKIGVSAASVSVSGSAELRATRRVVFSHGTYSTTINTATIIRGVPYSPESISISVIPQNITFGKTNVLEVQKEDLSLSFGAELRKGRAVKAMIVKRKYWLR